MHSGKKTISLKVMHEEKMTSRLIMVTGGQRSGKSVFAEELALGMSELPTYLATARVMDEEMAHRVEIHKERRQSRWRNLESPLSIPAEEFHSGDVVLIDCLTLLATNWLFEKNENLDDALTALRSEIDKLLPIGATFIIVTNEIGLGGVSPNALQRKFADLQGYINQYVARLSQQVYFVASGIPVKIKG